MMIRRIALLLFSIFTGIIVFAAIVVLVEKEKNNGFVRLAPPHTLTGISFKDVKYKTWSIEEVDQRKLYLINNLTPQYIMQLDTGLKDTIVKRLLWPETMKFKEGISVTIDLPYVYLKDGLSPIIMSGMLNEMKVKQVHRTSFFNACLPLSPTSFILRSISGGKENILIRQTGLKLDYNTSILQKQIDGMFCTDGSLIRVPGTDKLVYVYHYRNQFMVMDTLLNLMYRGKTLDTISRAQLKVTELRKQHKLTLSSPPIFVNKKVSANKEYLFIQSALKADNEVEEVWEANTVIDVYALKDGKYKLSLYVPHFKDIKLKDFKVFGDRMYVLYDNYLYKYALNIK
jgi:hypothetical protein